jgi:hypothetical protein
MKNNMKSKNINYSVDLNHPEPEFFMEIPFESLDECLLSISSRQLSNRGSGLVRHTGNPNGARTVNGIRLDGVYGQNKRDARIYHATYDEHIEMLKLNEKLNEDKKPKDFVLLGNGNLGNNFWHVAWQNDQDKKLYCLEGEPFSKREYSCFIVPAEEKPLIERLGFDEEENPEFFGLKNGIKWCISGQQILYDNEPVPIKHIAKEFYDARHIFALKDWGPKKEEGTRILNDIFKGYPDEFEKNMQARLNSEPRAEYYHSVLGIKGESIVLYQSYGAIEDIASRLAKKRVTDAIVLDQGGSVGTYASWLNGYLNKSSYFRPERISTIAFTLK